MPPRGAVAQECDGALRAAFGLLQPAREHIRLHQVGLEKGDSDEKSHRPCAGVALVQQPKALVDLSGERSYPAEGACQGWPNEGDIPVVAEGRSTLEIRCRTCEVSA